ncbi:MAG: hypothetical protein OXU67_12180 [Chloroflexota bacterium]|nr:hypothetical protein [Chloroflexota bacterium]
MVAVEPIVSDRRDTALDERIASLADLYRFNDREAVTGFLQRHDFLVDLLVEAREHICTHFGPDTPTALEIFYDLDDEHEEPAPLALIETTLPAEEAYIHLDRLDETWWLDALPRSQFILTITLRFV